jgi:hypothetical protein
VGADRRRAEHRAGRSPDRRAAALEPGADDEAALRFDWEELAGMIGRGDVESINGRLGRFLQVRPKARDSLSRRRGTDADSVFFSTLPRGFTCAHCSRANPPALLPAESAVICRAASASASGTIARCR